MPTCTHVVGLNREKWHEPSYMSINHGAALGCEITRLEHAPGEASAYVTLVKFEQSVVLSLARTITPDIVNFREPN